MLGGRNSERSSPSLLDRLTDDEPAERRDPEHKRFASVKQLRESVVRDLGWLLNCVRMQTVRDLSELPHVARSVLNFGLPDLAGRTASSIDTHALEAQLREAIVAFEPRLLADSVEVSVASQAHESMHNCLQLNINAELNTRPMPIALRLRTEIDLETGEVNIAEWERGRQITA
jgi:type VI secretion system protein ImpF